MSKIPVISFPKPLGMAFVLVDTVNESVTVDSGNSSVTKTYERDLFPRPGGGRIYRIVISATVTARGWPTTGRYTSFSVSFDNKTVFSYESESTSDTTSRTFSMERDVITVYLGSDGGQKFKLSVQAGTTAALTYTVKIYELQPV